MRDPQGPESPQADAAAIFRGDSELCALMRAKAWSQTPIGPLASWPPALRTAVSVMLGAPHPICMYWGPELAFLYNDHVIPLIGDKHPGAIGVPGARVFAEVWEVAGPMFDGVMRTDTAVYVQDQPLFMERQGFVEEAYFTWSYVPVRDERSAVVGIFCIVNETTRRVLGERRFKNLHELSIRAAQARTSEGVLRAASEVLAGCGSDVPFGLMYRLEAGALRLVLRAGLEAGASVAPAEHRLTEDAGPWPLGAALGDGRPRFVDLPREPALHVGPWPEAVQRALLMPVSIEGNREPDAVLVLGVSPRLPVDEGYRDFLQLFARQIAADAVRVRVLEQEQERARQLAALDRDKTQFFSNVSHEFRTPLTLILGPTEDAIASPAGALSGDQLERVHGNAQRLLKLVNTLLEFSRVEAGRSRATFRPTELAALTAGLANAFESVVEHAGLAFVVDCPPLPEPIWVDAGLWEKVVLNLVSNAFKFTLAGRIDVALRWTGHGIELTVGDTGIGIAPDELPNVFRRFHRIEGAQGRTHEGSGIGLSLVEALVKLHGGEVRVTSAPGVGTTFTVTLPAGNAHLPTGDLHPEPLAVAPTSGTSAFVREAAQWGASTAAPDEPAPRSQPASAGAPTPRARVLLADDNVDMRGYVQRVLEEHFTVEAVADGRAALAAARERVPDVVLSDVMMPVMDGIALTRALRADPRTRDVPVVLLSARVGESATVEGLEAGADDYIVKPFGARELVARVDGAMRVARAEAARRRALERVAEIIESSADGFFSLDSAFRFVAVNASYERITRSRREDVIGQLFWDVFPAARDPSTRYWQEYNRAMNERVPVQFLAFYAPLDLWADLRAYPTPDGGIAVSFRDMSKEVRASAVLARQAEFEQQLIGIVSNDLRDPLNLIMTASSLLSEEAELGVQARQFVARIDAAADRATRLVRDLLDFTQARLGDGLSIGRRPADLHALVRAVMDALATAFPRRQMVVRLQGDAQGVWDPDRLTQMVQNLLSNALKYSPSDTPVRVEVRASPADVTLVVQNGGTPIPAESLPILFEPLQRAGEHRDRTSRSVGLGLYIVKKIVEAHHGTVEVQSTADEGTTFTVTLPRSPTPAPAAD